VEEFCWGGWGVGFEDVEWGARVGESGGGWMVGEGVGYVGVLGYWGG
jgi:hypothetical protein